VTHGNADTISRPSRCDTRVAQTLLLMSASRTVLRAGMPTALRRTRSLGDAYIYRDVCATQSNS
jgi:hypothetical protein